MNRVSRLLTVCRLCSPKYTATPANSLIRYQPQLNYSNQLPRIKRPGEGKGPISWKSFKWIAGCGAVLFGILKYLEAQKEAGLFNR